MCFFCFFFQAEDGIRDLVRSRGLGDVYKRQGRGKFADIVFNLGPVDAEWKAENPDKSYQFVNDLFGGSIPREFAVSYTHLTLPTSDLV